MLPLWGDAELRHHDDLQDVRLAIGCQLLQARIEQRQAEPSKALLVEVRQLAADLDDTDALRLLERMAQAVQDVQRFAAEDRARAARAERVRTTSVDAIRDAAAGRPQVLADALVKKANAECDAGNLGVAVGLAQEALAIARDQGFLREEVFAGIALSRAEPQRARAHLEAAWSVASGANEHTLVSTIARACDVAGIQLAVQVGPDRA